MEFKRLIYAFLLIGLVASCSNLEEEIRDTVPADIATAGSVDIDALLQGVYEGFRTPYQDQSRFWAANQHTSDETLGPTRGPDWDDNGIWRVLHDHTWDADHGFLKDTYNELLQIVFNASVIVSDFNPSPQQAAEARFLRAFAMFSVADGWNQVPFREDLSNFALDPIVYTGTDALDFIISEVTAIQADLPDGPANRANKDAASALLMKVYLNYGTIADRTAPKFPAADMSQVISLADGIINSGKYALADNIFDNFAPNNDAISTENIFTNENRGGESSGNVRSRWFCGLHYNQNPSGWNGFATLSDFYDSFEDGDMRKEHEYAGSFEVGGVKNGFLVGQQYDGDGNELEDRKGNPLDFTREVAPIETGSNLEVTGIRVMKYPIDYNSGDNVDNDYVLYRYADVMMMKAEAMMRNGDAAGALAIVNEIRAKRSASAMASIDEAGMLAERGREFCWEGMRRQDLIRFGKFLGAWQGKPASTSERLLFPIPNTALATNPNLVQNPGY